MGRILVVDDCVDLVRFFQTVLTNLGHETIGAYDGDEAIRRFHDELPDLVFVDLVLPRRDGSEVLATIQRTEHGLITPVVLMTGVYRHLSKLDTMRNTGAVDFLIKPIPVDKIQQLVEWVFKPRPEEAIDDLDPEIERLESERGTESEPANDLLERLRSISLSRQTGVLVATRGKLKRALNLVDGQIAGVRSNIAADRLDRVLASRRLLSPAQMAEVRQLAPQEDTLGALLKLGYLGPESAASALSRQAIAVALGMFRWRDAVHHFFPGAELRANGLERPLHPVRIALLALRRDPDLRAQVGSSVVTDTAVFALPLTAVAPIVDTDLARRERDVLAAVNGEREVSELREMGSIAQIPVDEALRTLAGAGLIRPLSAEELASRMRRPEISASGEQLQGTLALRSLPELLGLLSRDRATGILTLAGAFRCAFSVRRGEVVFARSADPGDRLGQYLLSRSS